MSYDSDQEDAGSFWDILEADTANGISDNLDKTKVITLVELVEDLKKRKGEPKATEEWTEYENKDMCNLSQIYDSVDGGSFDIVVNLMTSSLWDQCLVKVFPTTNKQATSIVKATLNDDTKKKKTDADKSVLKFLSGIQRSALNSDGRRTRSSDEDKCVNNIVVDKKVGTKAKLMAFTTSQLRSLSDKSRQSLLQILSDKDLLKSAWDFATSTGKNEGELNKLKVR